MLMLSRLLLQNSLRPILQVSPRQVSTLGALYAAFTVRDLTAGSHGEAGTLISRFIKHIALEKCKTDPLVPQKIKYSSFYPVTDLSSLRESILNVPTDQIPRLIIYTYTYKTNGDPHKVTQVLNLIDSLCLERIEEMDHDTLLSVLYAFMYLLPNKITKFEFYPRCIQRLVAEMRTDCPKDMFVEVCFYLGLWKKHRRSIDLMNRIVTNHLEHQIDQLNQIEFAIVTNALFKSSTISNIPSFNARLVDEVLKCDGSDDSLLVSFVKSMRLNRLKSDKVYEQIMELNSSRKLERMQFKGLAHLLALFADGLYNSPEVCTSFVRMCLSKLDRMDLNRQHAFNDMRAKDLATFIWACATLRCSHHLSEHFGFLEELVQHKIERDEYQYAHDDLIETVLSLWMLGHKSRDLVQAVFDLRSNSTNTANAERVKLDSRFELLKSCIHIEHPNWLPSSKKNQHLFEESRPAPNYLVEKQTNLQNISNLILENKDELGVKSVKNVTPIHQLNIASILLELNSGKKCFVEVLESGHVMQFEEQPVVFVDLKIRLLEHLGYSTHLIQPTTNSDETLAYIKECLNNTDMELTRKKGAV